MIGKNNIGKGESCYGSTVNGNAKEKFREDSLGYSEIISINLNYTHVA